MVDNLDNQEIKLYWMQCLEMALYYNPISPEEQIEIANILYKSSLDLDNNNKNKNILERALEKTMFSPRARKD
jgi:hypothetical protein